ncbi:hypothetical protein GCM10023162_13900 [Klenkia terrae]
MKFSKRGAALVATGIAGAMVLSACGGGSSDSGGGEGDSGSGRVIFGESTDFPENLFPYIAAGNATSVANLLIRVLPGPYVVNPDFSVDWDQDLLASEPELDTSSGQVNTYEINPDAVWSDGTPITAADFEFTWRANRSSDPADGGCPALLGTTGYEQIASVEASGDDDKTVTVTYTTPFSDWQSLFGNLLPAHVMDNDDPAALCESITNGWPIADGIMDDISGGPWQIKAENIDVGSQIVTLTPNPEWWGEPTGLAQLVVQNIGNDPTAAVQAMSNQELGVIYPQPQLDLVSQIEDLSPAVESDVNFGLSFEHLDFNTTYGPLSSLAVRQAFTMALDRQEIVDQTVGQFSSDAEVLENRIFFNNQPQYQDTAPDEYKTQNTAMAKSLLEAADRADRHHGQQPAARDHDQRHDPAAGRGRHRGDLQRQPGHLRRRREADLAGGRWLPGRRLRLGRVAVPRCHAVDLRAAAGRRHRAELLPPGHAGDRRPVRPVPDRARPRRAGRAGQPDRRPALGPGRDGAAVPEAHVHRLPELHLRRRGQLDPGRSALERRHVDGAVTR